MNPINIHKITFERWSNSNSDITFRMHNKDKICKIIQYLKNEKTENYKSQKVIEVILLLARWEGMNFVGSKISS